MLWRLLCSRGRGAHNNFGNNSFDDRYRNKKNARLGCPRRGRSDTQDCHARRRVATYLNSPLHCFKEKKALAEEERVAERLVYSRFYTQAPDRTTNGVEGLLEAMEDKRIIVRLHAVSKA
jgi:hypothetical protein